MPRVSRRLDVQMDGEVMVMFMRTKGHRPLESRTGVFGSEILIT